MTTATRPASEDALKPAIFAVAAWQKTLTDNPYDPDAGEQRLRAQQRLATATLASADETIAVILDQADGQVPETALDTLPTLQHPIIAHEILNSNWQTDFTLHAALTAAGTTRSQTMEFGWWHLLTLRLLADRKLPDPPVFLLDLAAPGSLPFDRTSLTATHEDITPQQRKGIDRSIRNLIRHSGGIWHRRGRWLFDAPLAAAWWRVEIAQTASGAASATISAQAAYEALNSAWRVWADSAARNSTRLAAPNCAAAYVLAASTHKQRTGSLPTGTAAKQIVTNLMRRTQHLSVPHIDPQVLASLAT